VRVLIVDDEPLARERLRTLLGARPDVTVVGECGDGRDAVAKIESLRPDLVLLDVQMPEMGGFEVVDAVSPAHLPAIIFVTAYDEHAIRAFDVDAVDYVLKPVQPDRFGKAMDRAAAQAGGPRFVVRQGARLSFVRADDVDWIESASNYARLHAGGRAHLVRETMKALEERLDPARFVRVHRSAIVNLDRVASVAAATHGELVITMRDGATVPASRTYAERLRSFLR
jgi:two-component system LytT family response regulator